MSTGGLLAALGIVTDVADALGKDGRISSGYRSPQKQQSLYDQGKTPLKGGESSHNKGDAENPQAVDIVDWKGSKADLQQRLTSAGLPVRNIIQETGKGKNQGTGAHFHVNFGEGGDSHNHGGGGGANAPAPEPRVIQPASKQERQAMEKDKEFKIADPFAEEAVIGEQTQEVRAKAGQAQSVFEEVSSQIQEAMDDRLYSAADTVRQKKEINDTLQADAEQTLNQMRPLLERRVQLADKRAEIAQMNPLERLFAGAFDPDKNLEALGAEARVVEGQISARYESLQQLSSVQQTLLASIAGEGSDMDALLQLNIGALEQDARLANLSLSAASQVLESSLSAIGAQGNVTQAQQAVRNEVLGNLSLEQATEALADARANGDGVEVNGVFIPLGQMAAAQQALDSADISMQSRQIALEQGKLNLADRHEADIIDKMTPEQVKSAIENNGMWQGQQFSVSKLAIAQQNHKAMADQKAGDILNQESGEFYAISAKAMGSQADGTTQRMQNLFGAVPPSQKQYVASLSARFQAHKKKIEEAKAAGVRPRVLQGLMQEFGALQKQQEQVIDSAVKAWAGGNKSLEGIGNAWVRGLPITGSQAAEALDAIAAGDVPSNIRMSGPAAQVFRRIQQQNKGKGKPTTEEEKAARVESTREAAASQFVQSSMNEVMATLPETAAGIRDENGRHPFSRVDPGDYRYALQEGDKRGEMLIAENLGLKTNELRDIAAKGKFSKYWKQAEGAEIISGVTLDTKTVGALNQYILGAQTQEMLRFLDKSQSATPDFKPSSAFADLFQNPQFLKATQDAVTSQGGSSFGDYITSAAGLPGFESELRNYAGSVQTAHAAIRGEERQIRNQFINDFEVRPQTRLKTVLGNMDSLSDREAQQLYDGMSKLEINGRNIFYQGTGSKARNRAVDDVILKHKLPDPYLEGLRKKAAKEWERSLVKTSRLLNTMWGQVTEGQA